MSITGGGWVQPAYDLAGNMTLMPQPTSPTASLAGVYDAWNRLVSPWIDGAAAGVYRYDGIGRRVTTLVGSSLRHIYYTASWQPIEERLGVSTTFDRQFVWGLRYLDDLVLRDRQSDRLYVLQDPNWNVTAIADTNGTVVERYRYAAYGQFSVLTGGFAPRATSSYDWEIPFAAYTYDFETGLYLARLRYFHSLVGTWISRDSFPTDGESNYYAYVLNAPTDCLDPYGAQRTCPAARPATRPGVRPGSRPGVRPPGIPSPGTGAGGAVDPSTFFRPASVVGYEDLCPGDQFLIVNEYVDLIRRERAWQEEIARLRKLTTKRRKITSGGPCRDLMLPCNTPIYLGHPVASPTNRKYCFKVTDEMLVRVCRDGKEVIRGTDTTILARKMRERLGLPTDQAGHILAQCLGGSGGYTSGNIFPIDQVLNEGDFAKHEIHVKKLVVKYGEVCILVKLVYLTFRECRW